MKKTLNVKTTNKGSKSAVSGLLSHVGIAVLNIERAIDTLRKVCPDLVEAERVTVAEQGVEVCFLEFPSQQGGRIELLRGLSPDSPISKFIEKRGEGLHHICFGCASVRERLSELREKGFELIDDSPRRGALGKNIAFIHPSSTHGALIELEEE